MLLGKKLHVEIQKYPRDCKQQCENYCNCSYSSQEVIKTVYIKCCDAGDSAPKCASHYKNHTQWTLDS